MTSITPMLASVGDELPRGDGWVFEPKYDGVRVLAFADGKRVALISRNGIDKAGSFPEIVDALGHLQARVRRPFVVDGEIVAMNGRTPLRFQDLQGRMHVSDRASVALRRTSSPTALMVFDLLADGGATLVREPWEVRREALEALFAKSGPAERRALHLSPVTRNGEALLEKARANGWEGIMAKRADAPYDVGRRSRAWLKLKLDKTQEFVIGGWTEPRNSREYLGAILLGYYDDEGQLIYAGHTGTGFSRRTLADLHARLSRLEQPRSPFTTTPKTNQPAHWARPTLVAEIKFNEWTTDGRLRQPVFLGLRDDKAARDVVRERQSTHLSSRPRSPKPPSKRTHHMATQKRASARGTAKRAPAKRATAKRTASRSKRRRTADDDGRAAAEVAPGSAKDIAAAKRAVAQLDAIIAEGGDGELALPTGSLEVSNLSKVYYPSTKTTKGDLMRYYALMSPALLPAMRDRPLVMKRFPNGVGGKAFYQQKAPPTAPPAVRVESVSDTDLTTADRLIGGDLATLLYLVQLGAISVDPWHSRVQSVQHADYSIVDLDPGPRAGFDVVVEVALAVKKVLDDVGLTAVAKTPGASGIHIVMPLARSVPNDGARILAEFVATTVAERHPRIATIERAVKARPAGVVYVDFLQNIRGKTVAGVYSVRAQPTATVSTPLEWDELTPQLDPTVFTIDTVPERVRERGDLWARAMKTPNKLGRLLKGAKDA